jgi:excisionase family DNA binding protein
MAKPRHTGNDANLEAARTLLRAAGYEDEAIEGAFFVLCNGTDGEAVSDELLSAREVCDLIGISLSTLWRWEIPHVRVGGLRRFYRSDIDKFLNRRYVRAGK